MSFKDKLILLICAIPLPLIFSVITGSVLASYILSILLFIIYKIKRNENNTTN